ARQPVLHRNDGRAPGAGAERDVIEAERESVIDRDRAAEAHPAIEREFMPALDQQPDHFEEVLVPAHGDAVFGDAAEPSHDAIVEPFPELLHVADRTKTRTGKP